MRWLRRMRRMQKSGLSGGTPLSSGDGRCIDPCRRSPPPTELSCSSMWMRVCKYCGLCYQKVKRVLIASCSRRRLKEAIPRCRHWRATSRQAQAPGVLAPPGTAAATAVAWGPPPTAAAAAGSPLQSAGAAAEAAMAPGPAAAPAAAAAAAAWAAGCWRAAPRRRCCYGCGPPAMMIAMIHSMQAMIHSTVSGF